jgi:hypothetical protein
VIRRRTTHRSPAAAILDGWFAYVEEHAPYAWQKLPRYDRGDEIRAARRQVQGIARDVLADLLCAQSALAIREEGSSPRPSFREPPWRACALGETTGPSSVLVELVTRMVRGLLQDEARQPVA